MATAIRLWGRGSWTVALTVADEKPVVDNLEDLKDVLKQAKDAGHNPGESTAGSVYTVDGLQISNSTAAVSASLHLKTRFDLPGVLCVADGGGSLRLRKLTEIAQDLDALAAYAKVQATAKEAEAKAALGTELARLVEQLRLSLGRQPLTFDRSGSFFGVTGVFAAAHVSLSLSVDTEALYAAIESTTSPPTPQELLRATLDAAIDFVFGTGAVTGQGRMQLACVVTDGSALGQAIELIAGIDLPQLQKLPRLRFDPPRIAFPGLSLPGLDLGDLASLVDLGLPDLVGGVPVRIEWPGVGTKPTVKIDTNSGALTWSFDAKLLTGTLQVKPGTDWVDLAQITGLKLAAGVGSYAVEGIVSSKSGTGQRFEFGRSIDIGGSLPWRIAVEDANALVSLTGTWDLAAPASASLATTVTIEVPRLVIRSRQDPRIVLVLSATWDATADLGGTSAGRLTRLEVLEPSPVALISAGAAEAITGLVRLIGIIQLHDLGGGSGLPPLPPLPPLPNLAKVVERIGELLVSALEWSAGQTGSGPDGMRRVLAGLAAPLLQAMGKVLDLAGQAQDAALSHMAIEVRLDARTYAVRQVLITPLQTDRTPSKPSRLEFAGLCLTVPGDWSPSLLLDFSGPTFAALIVTPAAGSLVLETDLWLERAGAPVEAMRDTDDQGQRPDPYQRLITLTVFKKATSDVRIALAVLDHGEIGLFKEITVASPAQREEKIEVFGPVNAKVLKYPGRPVFTEIDFNGNIGATLSFNANNVPRLLPLFGTPKSDANATSGNLIDKLGEYVTLKSASAPKLANSIAEVTLTLALHLGDFQSDVELLLTLDLSRMTAKLSGGEDLVIRGPKKHGDLFGLTYALRAKSGTDATFNQFRLALSGGNPRLVLHEDALFELLYTKLGTDGRGLVFRVQELAVAKGVFDLVAVVDPNEPVTLPGVGMPFRFREGRLVIKRGEIQSFAISGTGQLPPELVGEANCTVNLSLGAKDGRLVVVACDAQLDKTDDPIRCPGTRFTLTISKLGLAMEDFGAAGGYQFYFQVTGAITFTPPGGEFADSFLKNLRGAKLSLTKAPLGRDMGILVRAIDLQVTLDPAATIQLFNVFAFELRGFGFHPQADAFGAPSPALSISGQARFLETGDVVSAKIDFHQMWIAPPEPGAALPRVRFDGLGLSLSLKGAGTIEGTAVTVDENYPLFGPKDEKMPAEDKDAVPVPKPTARGFLASGRLRLEGWASMSAAMGFLEVSRPDDGERRHAFFLYAQLNELSEPIPTPFKEVYLREVGFGFGYRYTLAGLRRADSVTTPQALVQVLDDVSRYGNDLDNFTVWEPEAAGNRITLALRGMFSVMSGSPSGTLSPKEKELDNPLLFDVVAALRSDLTLLMTARAWPSLNYYNWVHAEKRDEIAAHPLLRGYLYLSAPRQELLARLVSDPLGYIGDTPKLSKELVNALKSVRWSSTLYMRPGLFHVEYGWPYELEIRLPQPPRDDFQLICQGGLVVRIEDLSLLYGIAFRANGFAKFGGAIGNQSLGASVEARADFSLAGKFIAYVSANRPGDTLFYGSLAFACTVEFQVRMWLELDLTFTTLRYAESFALRLSISIALEVALGPALLAGRGEASLAVAAFGRTLSLGVGFGFNTDALAEARARVERFLALGLEAAVPDPAAGLLPPPAAAPPQPADGTSEADAKRRAELSKIADGNPPRRKAPAAGGPTASGPITIEGQLIGAPRFWAVLFEIPAQPGSFVLQLVPRDRTGGADLGEYKLDLNDSTFFGLPPASGDAYSITLPTTGGLSRLTLDASGTAQAEAISSPTALVLAGDREVAEGLPLKTLLEQAFLREQVQVDLATGKVVKRLGKFRQPPAEAIETPDKQGFATPEAAARALREAASDMAMLSLARTEWRATEDLRSAIITAVCASAERIAREATVDTTTATLKWPNRAATSGSMNIDARDLGLTFVVTAKAGDDTLGGLFDEPGTGPGRSKFTIAVLDSGVPVTTKLSGSPIPTDETADPGYRYVHLYNPPSRFFDHQNPRLARLKWAPRPEGMVLDWDLEPAWGDSNGVWNDPEFHLKHYRVQRLFLTAAGGVFDRIKPFETTVKTASPLKAALGEDRNNEVISWQALRPLAQFVDDFADLPETWREGLRQQDVQTERGFRLAVAGWQQVAGADDRVRILYTVVPVDTAGREGVGTPIETVIEAPKQPVRAIARAELVIEYDRLPGSAPTDRPLKPGKALPAGAAATVTLRLRIDDLPDLDDLPQSAPVDREQPQRLPLEGTRYRLKVRRERALPIGLFGADALGAALQRPGAQELGRKDADDVEFDLTLHWSSRWRDAVVGADDQKKARRYRRERALHYASVGQETNEETAGQTPWFDLTLVSPGGAGSSAREALIKALGFCETGKQEAPQSVRVGIQRLEWGTALIPPTKAPPTGEARPSPWLAVDTLLWVGQPGADAAGRPTPRPIETVVETFESPCVTGHAPLVFDDLAGEAGRLLVHYPAPAGTLAQFVRQRGASLVTLRDGERRVATRIRWNATPTRSATTVDPLAGVPPVANAAPAFIAGHDLFEIDLTGVAEDDDQLAIARAVARVQTLDPRLARAWPAGIDDFGAIDAFYPSETLRLQGNQPGKSPQVSKAGARRHAWFSLAESVCAWPQPVLRRSLGLAANDADLARIFEWGAPDKIVIYWDGAPTRKQAAASDFGTGSWRKLADPPIAATAVDESNAAPTFTWLYRNRTANGTPSSLDEDRFGAVAFSPSDLRSKAPNWTSACLRLLLFGLMLGSKWRQVGTAGDYVKRARNQNGAHEYRDLTLVLEGRRGQGTTGTARLTMHLDQPLHPVLADAIDALAWERKAGQCYRRYRPVLEPAPATAAKSIVDLMAERPRGRDPYGWAALRTLGLAQGLRLLDLQTGDYLAPSQTLRLVNDAMQTALARYQGIELGAPMVEVLSSPEGLYTLASFDGGTPPVTGSAVGDLIDNRVCGLVQLSLRPLAERLVDPAAPGLARYFSVPPSTGKVQIDMENMGIRGPTDPPLKFNPKAPLRVDLIDLSSGLSAGTIIALAPDDLSSATPEDKQLRKLLSGGNELRSKYVCAATGSSASPSAIPSALLRVIAPTLDDDAVSKALQNALGGTAPASLAIPVPNILTALAKKTDYECFERFPPLDAQAMTKVVELASGALASLNVFLWYTARRFPETKAPVEPKDVTDAIVAPWADLTSRFLEHGPAAKPGARGLPFALATIPRPEPFRVPVQADGTMDILLLHKDRLARRRRYLVRPFGRYENLIAAWDAAQDGDPNQGTFPWVARRELRDSFPPTDGQDGRAAARLPWIEEKMLREHAVDIVVPRTEPLAPPVILSAGRVDVGEGTERRPGRLLEVIVARHQEEVAAEANSTVADRLQFEHTAFGFWREFAYPEWRTACEVLGQKGPASTFEINALPMLEPPDPVPAPDLSFSKAECFEEVKECEKDDTTGRQCSKPERSRESLPSRIADGWRGISVIRTQGVPHFYRTYLTAFAAAGVVVSKPVATVIPEGHHELHWPWEARGKTTAISDVPLWEIRRNDLVDPPTVRIDLSLPTVRLVDGIPFADRERWWPGDPEDQRVFRLPDPGVVYEVSTRAVPAGADGPPADSSPEAELLALPKAAPSTPTYTVKSSGVRLEIDGPPNSAVVLGLENDTWALTTRFKVRGGQAAPPPTPPLRTPPLPANFDSLCGAAGDFALAPKDWAGLAPFAPIVSIQIVITRPNPTGSPSTIDWAPFGPEVTAVLDKLGQYKRSPARLFDADKALDDLIGELKKYEGIGTQAAPSTPEQAWIDLAGDTTPSSPFGNPSVTLTGRIPAGLPPLSAPTYVAAGQISNWTLAVPPDCSFGLRAAFAVAMETAKPLGPATAASIQSGFTRPLFAALWELNRHDAAAADRELCDHIAPVAREIPDGLPGIAGEVAQALVGPKKCETFEWIVTVDLVIPKTVDVRQGAALNAFGALIKFLETTTAAYASKPGLGCFPALEALAAIERDGFGAASLRLPWVVTQDVNWRSARTGLTGLAGAGITFDDPGDPVAIILRRPPDETDMVALKGVIPGLSDTSPATNALALWDLITELAADQVFGQRRRPFLKAFKGLLDPLHHPLKRASEV